MTVKGNHSIKTPIEDNGINHKVSNKVQNGSGPMIAKSPPKDSNLNHYRPEKATPVRNVLLQLKISLHFALSSLIDRLLLYSL